MSLWTFHFLVLVCFLYPPSLDSASPSVSIGFTPTMVQQYTPYNITCQFANSINISSIQVTNVTDNGGLLYSYSSGVSSAPRGALSASLQPRADVDLSLTLDVLTIVVRVALPSDAGTYSCSVTESNTTTGTPPTSLAVNGCPQPQMASVTGCPAVSIGSPCTVTCKASCNCTVSLTRNIDGSNPLNTENFEEGANYTINSVQSSDLGTYYCYVASHACISQGVGIVSSPSVTTTPKNGNSSCVNGQGGTGCGSGGRKIPGWGIFLIVLACIVVVAVIVAAILYFLYKQGIFGNKETVEPNVESRTAVSNDNYIMSRSKTKSEDERKKERNGSRKEAEINFPEVKTRKSQLPPLEPISEGNFRRSGRGEREDSPEVGKYRRPLPRRSVTTDGDDGYPDAREERRRDRDRDRDKDREEDEDKYGGSYGSPDRNNRGGGGGEQRRSNQRDEDDDRY